MNPPCDRAENIKTIIQLMSKLVANPPCDRAENTNKKAEYRTHAAKGNERAWRDAWRDVAGDNHPLHALNGGLLERDEAAWERLAALAAHACHRPRSLARLHPRRVSKAKGEPSTAAVAARLRGRCDIQARRELTPPALQVDPTLTRADRLVGQVLGQARLNPLAPSRPARC